MITLTRILADGDNDGGKGWQCSKYAWYLASGIRMNYAPNPDFGPCNGVDMVNYLVNKLGWVKCGKENGAIFAYQAGKYGHTGAVLDAATNKVSHANYNSSKVVSTNLIALDSKPGIMYCKPKEETPPPAPTPPPSPQPVTYTVGESVVVTGVGTADSYGGGAKTRQYKGERGMITIIKNDGRVRPFAMNMNNNMNGVTGWFSADSIKKG